MSILDSPLLKTFDKLHAGCILHRFSNPPRISLLIRVRVGLPGWDPPPGPFPGPGPGCKCEVARRVAGFVEGLKAAAVKTGVGPRRGAFRDLSKVFRHGLSKIGVFETFSQKVDFGVRLPRFCLAVSVNTQ